MFIKKKRRCKLSFVIAKINSGVQKMVLHGHTQLTKTAALHENQNGIAFHHEKNSIYIAFDCRRIEMEFHFVWSFDLRSLFWWIMRMRGCFLLDDLSSSKCLDNILSSELKFNFCQNDCKWINTRYGFHFGVFHVNSYKRLTRHGMI